MSISQNTGNTARLSPDEAAQQLVASNNEVAAWWASLPAGRGPVIGGEPTGLLSLEERADRGLLADNPDWLPAQEELPLDDVLWLECPTNTGRRAALAAHIRTAIDLGLLVTDPDKPGVIQRDRYRQWRAQCPASLLSESSVIAAWTGEHHPVSVSEPPPESVAKGGGNPANSRQCVADKASFIKSATWQGNQTNTVNQHPQAAYFKGKYLEDSLLQWAGELDPRPKDKRGGRPRKT
jgi:hypothetical protein